MTGDSQGVDVQAVVQADRFPRILSLLPESSLEEKEEKRKNSVAQNSTHPLPPLQKL
jgi:hypothetical protein